MSIKLSPAAQAHFNEIAYSLDEGDGNAPSSSDVYNYALETLASLEAYIGDPVTYIDTLRANKQSMINDWNNTVLSDSNPNARLLRTLEIDGKVVYAWLKERYPLLGIQSQPVRPEMDAEKMYTDYQDPVLQKSSDQTKMAQLVTYILHLENELANATKNHKP